MKWIVPARVVRVIDGDTLIVNLSVLPPQRELTNEHVRVAKINAPELGTVEGANAKNFAQALMPVGAVISLTMRGQDPYGRTIAEVALKDGRNFGEVMLQSGHAVPYTGDKLDLMLGD